MESLGNAVPLGNSKPCKPQYHHYIPRFILRNFAHPFEPSKNVAKPSKKREKHRRGRNCRPGDLMIHTINLEPNTPELVETPISRIFGMTDLYRDFAHSSNQHHIEQQLSQLESQAGEVISKMRKALDSGDKEIWITRPERDVLRKFLFIMKYRGSMGHRRFYHENSEDYAADDKGKFLRYMHDKGFRKPVDVWYDNIKAILDLKMDPEAKWMTLLKDRMYPDDAMWYIAHTQFMYLALCTPSDPNDEFLLTENLFSVHEGPVSELVDAETGKRIPKCYTEYHVFAVISPKLVMVLRSFLLPIPEEDSNNEIREWREKLYRMNATQHNDPCAANSILADLPIRKARNSYTKIIGNRLKLLDGEDGSLRSTHKFCFRFFPISTEHANKINSIILENAFVSSNIAFKSHAAFRKTLEFYLSMPCRPGFKVVENVPEGPRLTLLKKLELTLRQLGSGTTAVYQTENFALPEEQEFEILGRMFEHALPEEPTDIMKLYMKLGGSGATMPKDMDQASRMVKMRIKIDVWSNGLDEDFRETIRENLRDLFCELPSRRVWYYLKHLRHLQLKGFSLNGDQGSRLDTEDLMDGPEDVLVRVSHLINGRRLCRLMYFATINHIHISKTANLDFSSKITLDANGARRLGAIKYVAFGPAGSICDCGIPSIEERARSYMGLVRHTILKKEMSPFLTGEENVERATRALVRRDLHEILGASVEREDGEALKQVLFDIVYPYTTI